MVASVVASASSFGDRIAQLLRKVEYRRAESTDEREAIFRLRYQAYLREGAIGPNSSKRFTDPVDNQANTWNFGVYIDDVLAGSSASAAPFLPVQPPRTGTAVRARALLGGVVFVCMTNCRR
jgi:hypothetical protein